MATKTSDLLNSIPSAAELLERPPVKALVERWNRSVVAGGMRSFLDDLQSDLKRRATDAGIAVDSRAGRASREVRHPDAAAVVAAGDQCDGPAARFDLGRSSVWRITRWNAW